MMLPDDLEAARHPPISLPAERFGPAAACGPPAAAAGSLPASLFADLPELPRCGRLDVICLRPIHHVLEYEELFRLTAALGSRLPGLPLHLHLRSAVRDPSPFALLPAARVERLGSGGGRGALAAGLRRLIGEREVAAASGAGAAADVAGAGAAAAAVVLAPPAGWRRPRLWIPGLGAAWTAPLGFAGIGCGGGGAGAACAAASERFLAALWRESPLWRAAAGAAPPLSRRTAGHRFLIHQARFHVGDTLWLTPLLRALGTLYRRAHVTLVGPPVAAEVLAGNLHLGELLCYQPRDGEAGRSRVLAALAGRRFDAALFAFARRHESAWLARAMAAAAVPRRVNLEYHDLFQDSRGPWPPFTHEGWLFWGMLPSPRLLLHALDPVLPGATAAGGGWQDGGSDATRLELHLAAPARRRASELLAARGIGDRPFAVLAPGGWSAPRWPAASFARLAVALADELGLAVIVEGSSGEAPLLREVAAAVAAAGSAAPRAAARRPIVVCQDPLEVFAAVLARARLLVGNDSGPLHLAAALGVPCMYFTPHQNLAHSHPPPGAAACWALFDGQANDLRRISVEQALGALREMRRQGVIAGPPPAADAAGAAGERIGDGAELC
jgi:ADP-heptose:LPS heptosyltransferase